MRVWGIRIGVVLVVLAALAIALLFVLDWRARSDPQDLGALPVRRIDIHGKPIQLLVAQTPDTVGRGLSGQPSLPADHALWLRSSDGDTRVTMLGMRFALDVVWLDDTCRVVHLERAVPARAWPLAYSSPHAATSVLELVAGAAADYRIAVGDHIGCG